MATDAEIKQELNKCTNLDEMLKVFSKHYDTQNCKPGAIVKATILNGLNNIKLITGIKQRK